METVPKANKLSSGTSMSFIVLSCDGHVVIGCNDRSILV